MKEVNSISKSLQKKYVHVNTHLYSLKVSRRSVDFYSAYSLGYGQQWVFCSPF